MAALFDINAIKANNSPEKVFAQLSIAFIRKGDKLKSLCPRCGKDRKFDYSISKDVFNCFSCDLGGSGVIDLVIEVLGRDFVEACKFLGGANELSPSEKRAAQVQREEHAAKAKRALANHRRQTKSQMKKILAGCQDGGGTLAQTYLEARGHGAALVVLGWPEDILFHPSLEAFAGEGKDRISVGHWPAMISIGRNARIQNSGKSQGKGQPVLLHRTYLAHDGSGKAAPVLPDDFEDKWNAKQMVGVLSMCDSGVYLGAVGDNETGGVTDNPNLPIIVAEGIESTLAIATAGVSGIFFAALSLNRLVGKPSNENEAMRGWRPLHKGRPVIIACDNDLSPTPQFDCGEARAQSLFLAAADRLEGYGHKTGLWFPPVGCDPEDALFHKAPSGQAEKEKTHEGSFSAETSPAPSVPGADGESAAAALSPETPPNESEAA